MKKVLLLFALLIATALNGRADMVALVANGATYTGSGVVTRVEINKTQDAKSIELSSVVKIDFSKAAFYEENIRFYANSTLTVTPQEGITIEKVSFKNTQNTMTTSTLTMTSSDGSYNISNNELTWTGSTTNAIKFSTTPQVRFEFLEITYTSSSSKTIATLNWSKDKDVVKIGEEYVAPTFSVTPNEASASVVFNSNNPDVATVNENGVITLVEGGVGTASITASIPEDDETYRAQDAVYTVTVKQLSNNQFEDVLTNAADCFNAQTGNGYIDKTYTSESTGIKYVASLCVREDDVIQLRSKNNNSGIVINANPNGYVLKQIVVDWYSNSDLYVYGADEAFEIAKMYVDDTVSRIGSLANGATTFEPTEDYSFIGLRSKSGAIYLNSITLVWEKKEYSAEGAISFGDAYSYDEYSTANVLTFKPTIKFNGAPIEDGYGEYTVLLNGVELGQADQAISHFAPVNGTDNKFQLRKGTKVIDVDVAWPAAINAKPAIKGVRYVQNDDNTLDAVYNIAPEDETPGYSWLVNVSNEGAELGWTENAATCTFKNVGAEAVNAPEKINAALVIPFAVKSTDGTAALAEGDEVYDVVEYSAPVVELSTAEVAKPNESNTSGVADVAVDQNSTVEYYNLQGVRVNGDLTPGLYIRRQGNQATKVVVR